MKRYFLFAIVPLFLFGSCTRKSGSGGEETSQVDSTLAHEVNRKQVVHVFFENSGSMNGYINVSSDFQMAIGRAIQLMKYKYGENNVKVYYINQTIHECQKPDEVDLYQFVQQMLEKEDFTTSGMHKQDKGTASTDLNEIIKQVLEFVDDENTAVLISDFVYSLPSTTGVTTSLLYGCQNLTMSAFLEKTKGMANGSSLATNLIQLHSRFDGKYWHWKNPTGNGYVNLNCIRPYYMCVLGTDENVNDFNMSIDVCELKGYKNQFTISNKDVSRSSYTVLDTKYKSGAYRHEKADAIHSINSVSKNSKGEFKLGIGIDLSGFDMSESDKLDVANYNVDKGNYEIIGIEVIDTNKLPNPADKELVRKNNCTHAIVLSCVGFPNNISISIKRKLPIWVSDVSSTDDRDIATDSQEQLKTLGLSYFVEGVADAYNYLAKDKNNFMVIDVLVNK